MQCSSPPDAEFMYGVQGMFAWKFCCLTQLEKYNLQENSNKLVVDLSNAMFNDNKIK